MDTYVFILCIIGIVTVAGLIKSRHRAKAGIITDMHGNERAIAHADSDRMQNEIKSLKERIAVLERLATDNNSAVALDREIEKLR